MDYLTNADAVALTLGFEQVEDMRAASVDEIALRFARFMGVPAGTPSTRRVLADTIAMFCLAPPVPDRIDPEGIVEIEHLGRSVRPRGAELTHAARGLGLGHIRDRGSAVAWFCGAMMLGLFLETNRHRGIVTAWDKDDVVAYATSPGLNLAILTEQAILGGDE